LKHHAIVAEEITLLHGLDFYFNIAESIKERKLILTVFVVFGLNVN